MMLIPVFVLLLSLVGYIGTESNAQEGGVVITINPGATNSQSQNPIAQANVTVTVGSNVTWLNQDSTPHLIASGTPEAGPSNVFYGDYFETGKRYNVTFDQVGVYDYYDPSWSNIWGQVTVVEVENTTNATTATFGNGTNSNIDTGTFAGIDPSTTSGGDFTHPNNGGIDSGIVESENDTSTSFNGNDNFNGSRSTESSSVNATNGDGAGIDSGIIEQSEFNESGNTLATLALFNELLGKNNLSGVLDLSNQSSNDVVDKILQGVMSLAGSIGGDNMTSSSSLLQPEGGGTVDKILQGVMSLAGSIGGGGGNMTSVMPFNTTFNENLSSLDPGRVNEDAVETPSYYLSGWWGRNGTGDGEFVYPQGIAINNNDEIYISDFTKNNIQKFSRQDLVVKWGSQGTGDGQFLGPRNLALDSSGNVYVPDYNNNRIQKFDSNGTFMTTWGSQGTGDGQF
ncbi:MAG: hypothetical protein M3162_02340, partial [Thermoproteota archaeon]|nr:hypothetical protein [Thermoproteota archaeon]